MVDISKREHIKTVTVHVVRYEYGKIKVFLRCVLFDIKRGHSAESWGLEPIVQYIMQINLKVRSLELS